MKRILSAVLCAALLLALGVALGRCKPYDLLVQARDHLLFKFGCVSFVRYSFRHRKTPHLLIQALYHT
jgi:hypothetical protein